MKKAPLCECLFYIFPMISAKKYLKTYLDTDDPEDGDGNVDGDAVPVQAQLKQVVTVK